MPRIVIIGAVAAGTSAASQAKRRAPEAEVVLLERGLHVSYGACSIPYNIADPARDIEDVVVVSPDEFRTERHVDLRTGHAVTGIEADRHVVHARRLADGSTYELPWDRLVLATGARAVLPSLPGLELPGVFVLRELTDGARVKEFLATAHPRRAVIIGGGYIGLEMAETLHARGLAVTIVEKAPQLIPGFETVVADVVQADLARRGVRIVTGDGLRGVEQGDSGLLVRTERDSFDADLVLVAVGVKPNVDLARAAGVRLGPTGAISVDDHQRTNLPDVFAAGDCAEALQLVSGRPTWMPLGTTANKQGKVAGANATGADERFRGIVGTAGFKVFELEVARTGLTPADAADLGLDAIVSVSRHVARGPPAAPVVTTTLLVERGTRRLLGAQMVGAGAVAKRIDVFAAALHARMTVDDVEALDLSYAPPFAPVYDPILIAATVAKKELAGR